jgi:hypothetical protein
VGQTPPKRLIQIFVCFCCSIECKMSSNGSGSNTASNYTNDDEALENAFALIQQGNKYSSEQQYWEAADRYSQAQAILNRLSEVQQQPPTEAKKKRGDGKIQALYRAKAGEYRKLAREALIEALQQETAAEDAASSTDDDEAGCAQHRVRLFGRLFAGEMVDDPEAIAHQESSLEDRLRALTHSLPVGSKSEDERIRHLNKGLARLGLSVITNHNTTSTGASSWNDTVTHVGRMYGFHDALNPKSEAEQVDDIIAQAKDEVAITGDGAHSDIGGSTSEGMAGALLNTVDGDNEVDDSGEDSMDDGGLVHCDDVEDANLTPDVCRLMQDQLVAAQVNLSELVALFEVDEGGDAEIEFNQARGRQALKDAIVLLKRVQRKWNEC